MRKARADGPQPGEGLTLAGPTALLPFSVPDRGGFSVIFPGRGHRRMLRVGYGQVETDDGMTPPVGLAIFGSRLNGILVSEAGVPAVPPPFWRDGSSPRPTGPSEPASPWPTPTTRPPRSPSSSPTAMASTPDTTPSRWDPGNRSRDFWTRSLLMAAARCWEHSPSHPTSRSPSSRCAGSSMSAPSS